MKKSVFTVVDIETTGLSAGYHKITEISAFKVSNKNIVDEYTTLINPKVRIPSFITRLTGIDNSMVQDSPVIDDAIFDFFGFVKGTTFVAHNATFDFNFLNEASLTNIGRPLNTPILCTMKLAKRLLPDLPSKRLGVLCDLFKIENSRAHRARGDAYATVHVFNRFSEMLEDQGLSEHNQVLKYQTGKISR